MTLQPADQVWCPVIHSPDYLSLLRQGQRPPSKAEDFLRLQVDLLNRLVSEASQQEVEEANRRLDRDLPQELLSFLPTALLTNPQTPKLLLLDNPVSYGTPLHQWLEGFNRVLRSPLLPQAEARQVALDLSLEAYLNRLLV